MSKREAVFDPQFTDDLEHWTRTDPNIARKIDDFVREILQTPFTGRGKPEPLKYQLQGAWSRRLNKKDRIVYIVDSAHVAFLQCRYHY